MSAPCRSPFLCDPGQASPLLFNFDSLSIYAQVPIALLIIVLLVGSYFVIKALYQYTKAAADSAQKISSKILLRLLSWVLIIPILIVNLIFVLMLFALLSDIWKWITKNGS